MDKLTEIMAWKRREIAASLRPVTEAELAAAAADAPKPPRLRRRSAGPTDPWP